MRKERFEDDYIRGRVAYREAVDGKNRTSCTTIQNQTIGPVDNNHSQLQLQEWVSGQNVNIGLPFHLKSDRNAYSKA